MLTPMADPLEQLTRGLVSATGLSLVTEGIVSQAVLTSHRARIRAHITARLLGSGVTKDRVYPTRIIPVHVKPDLPAILVYTLTETVEGFVSVAPPITDRRLQLAVEIKVKGDRPDDQLDAIANLVEMIVLSDPGQSGLAVATTVVGTQFDFTDEGEESFGSATVTFEVSYQTDEGLFVAELLDSVGVKWDLGAKPDSQLEAQDEIDLTKEGTA